MSNVNPVEVHQAFELIKSAFETDLFHSTKTLKIAKSYIEDFTKKLNNIDRQLWIDKKTDKIDPECTHEELLDYLKRVSDEFLVMSDEYFRTPHCLVEAHDFKGYSDNILNFIESITPTRSKLIRLGYEVRFNGVKVSCTSIPTGYQVYKLGITNGIVYDTEGEAWESIE